MKKEPRITPDKQLLSLPACVSRLFCNLSQPYFNALSAIRTVCHSLFSADRISAGLRFEDDVTQDKAKFSATNGRV